MTENVFEGYSLRKFDDEPRVRDIEIAERAGLAQPRNIRQIIDKNREELTAHGELRFCTQHVQNKMGDTRGRPSEECWLNEHQAMAVVALMRTDKARELRIALVRAFIGYRRGAVEPVRVLAEFANGPRIGDRDETRQDMIGLCKLAAVGGKVSLAKVYGHIRKIHRISSPHFLSIVFWPSVKEELVQIGLGKIVLAGTKRKLALVRHISSRQLPIPGVE